MYTRPFLSITLVIIFMLSSCKKENSTPTPSLPKILKQTTLNMGQVTSSQYQYDHNGRVIHVLLQDSSYKTYEYSASTVHEKYYSRGGAIYSDIIYTLNDKGLAISSTATAYANVNWTETFEYDAYGFMTRDIRTTTTAPSYTKVDTYSDGNKTFECMDMGLIQMAYTYQFLNGSFNTIDNENTGITFFGKQSRNLIDTAQINTGFATGTAAYTYEYDSNKRVTKKAVIYTPGLLTVTTTYTYIQ